MRRRSFGWCDARVGTQQTIVKRRTSGTNARFTVQSLGSGSLPFGMPPMLCALPDGDPKLTDICWSFSSGSCSLRLGVVGLKHGLTAYHKTPADHKECSLLVSTVGKVLRALDVFWRFLELGLSHRMIEIPSSQQFFPHRSLAHACILERI